MGTNVHFLYAIKSEDQGEKVRKRGIYSQPVRIIRLDSGTGMGLE
jgi:hypothetical protein